MVLSCQDLKCDRITSYQIISVDVLPDTVSEVQELVVNFAFKKLRHISNRQTKFQLCIKHDSTPAHIELLSKIICQHLAAVQGEQIEAVPSHLPKKAKLQFRAITALQIPPPTRSHWLCLGP